MTGLDLIYECNSYIICNYNNLLYIKLNVNREGFSTLELPIHIGKLVIYEKYEAETDHSLATSLSAISFL